ncbi:MAG TPA: TIGR03000 domain-containing protein, partial [Urbifossiella sp.]|nr:TIGR03000 domain-containing protein [Urbifossiella sp.]
YGGYGGLGYGYGGYGYGGYGSSSPYYGGSAYPLGGSYYPSATPPLLGNYVAPQAGVASVPAAAAAAATVTVVVPDGAQVWFDGAEAKADGSNRVFTSPVLQPGQSSVLSVRVLADGSNRTMNLPLRAGDGITVNLRPTR